MVPLFVFGTFRVVRVWHHTCRHSAFEILHWKTTYRKGMGEQGGPKNVYILTYGPSRLRGSGIVR